MNYKNRFYGGSESLGYRVAAAICEKNEGFDFIAQVT